MNWETLLAVPRPPAVETLPKTSRGMPVPYITLYEKDGVDPHWTNLQAPGGAAIDCRCVFGEGLPILGKQCLARQRKALAQGLCNVCGKRVEHDVFFVGGTEMMPGLGRLSPWMGVEAPTHPRCLAYSAMTCPRLRKDADKAFLLEARHGWRLMDRWFVGPSEKDAVLREHGTPRPPFGAVLDMYVAVIERPEITTLAEWMPEHAPKPYRSLWTKVAA